MIVPWGLLTVLSLLCRAESRCSPTSYYKNCWIRRFPGIFIDIEESQRRGAQLLKHYQEETALKCSRTCCLTRNFSCNLAIFHYDTIQENVNCFHLHCPTLESCILSHRSNVVLYNITKGVDPDLLVFGKYFTTNVRVLPHHYGRGNASEPLASDKRQFNRPPPVRPTPAPTVKTSSTTTTTASRVLTAVTATTSVPLSTTQPTAALSSPPTAPPPPETHETHAYTTASSTPAISDPTSSPEFTPSMPPPSTTILAPHTAPTTPASPSSTLDATTSVSPSPPTPAQQQASSSSPLPTTPPPTSMAVMGSMESSKQYPNDTKGNLGRNQTTGSEGGQGDSGEDSLAGWGPGWHFAAHSLVVAVAICITVLFGCCCSILVVVSWRGQKKRMGRYRTSWRGKRGSMRLIKYVLVRESSGN
ncbi:uncharacterized protein mansc4 [Genypterus blacodes]|uniref:uncharacterized protein mansc4 n=1 Tax=Genypterus blacodes TaxID=154954 RepID=UPI003F770566